MSLNVNSALWAITLTAQSSSVTRFTEQSSNNSKQPSCTGSQLNISRSGWDFPTS